MAKKQFKAESKRLLDLMVNSIYTHKEIFLRELISNASDAIDKTYYKALSDENIVFNSDDYFIRITPDKKNRILTVTDAGIGMTREELEMNIGTIARSGSLDFKNEMEKKDGVEIIGQFGVGFYSAFMVSEHVTVISRAFGQEEATKWESAGSDGYTMTASSRDSVGTDVILKIKPNTKDEKYDEYLDPYTIKNLVKKYSDFIRYPIRMELEKTRLKEGEEGKYETYTEDEVLNSRVPIWRKNKRELKEEDYENFYMDKHFGYDKPLKSIHVTVDGTVSYTALLFIPARAPFDFYTKDFQKGLELYSNGVLIMHKCADLLPDYFGFVQGLVDSQDFSLNISREMLQHDRQLKFISKKIKDKIKTELLALQKKDREKYETFFGNFGRSLKYGLYNSYGAEKDMLQDLLMFYSSKEEKMVTLAEYISRMPEGQKYIYYAAGESNDRIAKLPQTERVADKGYEILYFTEDVDEFAIRMLGAFGEKEFKSVSGGGDLGLEDEQKDAKEKKPEEKEDKELFDFMKETLLGKVKEVRLSKILKSHPVCLTSEGALTIEMEKILSTLPGDGQAKADKVLEINPGHEIYGVLKKAFEEDREKLKTYTRLLYNQAFLIEGLPIADPVEFTHDVTALMK
jgi:molecular chaperone HtpG